MIFLYITTLNIFINFNQISTFYETKDKKCVFSANFIAEEIVENGKCNDYFGENLFDVGGK